MKYYIDFDNTLFNTEKFYNDLLKIVKKYNINRNDIELYYKNNDNRLFNPIIIINNLIKDEKQNKEMQKEIKKFFRDLSIYLYDDTLNFLEVIKKNNELILLTYGDFDYQSLKVNNAGIKDYFDKIIITNKNKGDLDLDYKNSVFIDDNKEQIEGLLRKGAKVIRIKRKGSKYFNDVINNVLEFTNLNGYLKER